MDSTYGAEAAGLTRGRYCSTTELLVSPKCRDMLPGQYVPEEHAMFRLQLIIRYGPDSLDSRYQREEWHNNEFLV